ncbi:MAG TPA: APC family permease [Solirubrobacteraceae bacterium]|nr:APC family permease [Solirubrobacteraceae bacterium]
MATQPAVSGDTTATKPQRLQKGQLSLPNCFALSAALMAPVIAVILNAPAAGPNSQGALPLSFLVAFVGTLFVANTVVQFSRRLPSSGLFYNYCSHALGGGAGFYTGWLYFAAFIMFAIGLFTANGIFLHDFLASHSVDIAWWILSLALMSLVLGLSYRSIKASVRVDLTLLGLEILVFSVLAVIAIANAGHGNTLHYFTPGASSKGVGGVGLGAVFGILSFVGFESAAVLGEETRNPRRAIPLAVIGATVIIGVFYVFEMYALAAGSHLNTQHGLNAFLADPTPFPTLAHRYASWMTNIIDIAAVFGLFSCFLAVQNATVRVIFSMGRDKVLPGVFGSVHKRFHSPYTAIYAVTALSIGAGLGLSAWLGSSLTDVYGWTGSLGTVAVILVYMLGNVALIRYFWRDSERNIFKHIVAPIVGIVALAYPLWNTVKPTGQAYPYNLVFWIVLGWVVAGGVVYYYFRSRSPEKLAAVGRVLAEDEEDLAEGHLASGPIHATPA